jgi:hypothetical protein
MLFILLQVWVRGRKKNTRTRSLVSRLSLPAAPPRIFGTSSSAILHREMANKVFGKRSARLLERFHIAILYVLGRAEEPRDVRFSVPNYVFHT